MALDIIKDNCCGCMACMNACPKGAISEKKDEYGFIYPTMDLNKCVNCGICNNVCDFSNVKREDHAPQSAYSLIYKDARILSQSTSGGAFTAFSNFILAKHGKIFGAEMDSEFTVAHHCAVTVEERDRMRGSLYVQSRIGSIYSEVKKELVKDTAVLFVGTPCQIGGLLSFLHHPYDNLYTVEFLCHGVPNNDFFKEHISFLEKRFNKKADSYSFRSKRYGWNHGIEEVKFSNGNFRDGKCVQNYSRLFQSGLSLRPSCLNCTYRKWERRADITIGDFWGIENITGIKDNKGVSLVFTNTEKGEDWVEKIRNQAIVSDIPLDKVKYRIATKPATSQYSTKEFWNLYLEKGYSGIVKRYCDTSMKARLIFMLKKLCRKWLCRRGKYGGKQHYFR